MRKEKATVSKVPLEDLLNWFSSFYKREIEPRFLSSDKSYEANLIIEKFRHAIIESWNNGDSIAAIEGHAKSSMKVFLKRKKHDDKRKTIASYDPNEDAYMKGECGVFAVALARILGDTARIKILSNKKAPGYNKKHPYDITHVFLEFRGREIDVKGIRSSRNMADDFSISNTYEIKGAWKPIDFMRIFMGNSNTKPLHGTETDIATASIYIKQNIEKYTSISEYPKISFRDIDNMTSEEKDQFERFFIRMDGSVELKKWFELNIVPKITQRIKINDYRSFLYAAYVVYRNKPLEKRIEIVKKLLLDSVA